MRILVTGGAGFIGSHIVDALHARGHECAVIDDLSSGSRANVRSGVPVFEVDISDCAAVARVCAEVRPQAVCHQAAQISVSVSMREPGRDAQVNVVGLLNVLAESVRAGATRVVFASSVAVLKGEATKPADERFDVGPISPYGIAKWVGERYLEFFAREHNLTCIALRYANVYGPRQNPHGEAGVVAVFCRKMLAGEGATINGDGRYVRDYVYGPDVAQANAAACEADLPPGFHLYHIGTGVGTDVNQLAAMLHGACQDALRRRGSSVTIPLPVHGPARPGDLRSSMVCSDKARRDLHWQPTVDVDQGLQQTVEWFAAQSSHK
jgi:UDP-glucose 4-epimerase